MRSPYLPIQKASKKENKENGENFEHKSGRLSGRKQILRSTENLPNPASGNMNSLFPSTSGSQKQPTIALPRVETLLPDCVQPFVSLI